MREKIITIEEVLQFSGKEEGHFFDRKSKQIKGAKIQKIAVAFANADGGDFIIGIKDNKEEVDVSRRWDGNNTLENFNSVFQALQEIVPSLPYTPTFLKNENDNTFCLLISVEKSSKVHSTADK